MTSADQNGTVKGALDPDAVEQELVEENGECPECHAEPQDFPDGHATWCKVGQVFQAVRTLRERLEEAEEERLEAEHVAKGERQQADKYRRKMRAAQDDAAGYKADWIAARRRADRLEERARDVAGCLYYKGVVHERDGEVMSRSDVKQLAYDRLRSALDSGEDEGEDNECSCEWSAADGSQQGGFTRVRRDPDCPVHGYDADATGSDSVHADEPEGDGMTDVQKARCIAYREGFGDGYDYARETDPPTDEPVSREGEEPVTWAVRFVACEDCPVEWIIYNQSNDPERTAKKSATAKRSVDYPMAEAVPLYAGPPTHADARSGVEAEVERMANLHYRATISVGGVTFKGIAGNATEAVRKARESLEKQVTDALPDTAGCLSDRHEDEGEG